MNKQESIQNSQCIFNLSGCRKTCGRNGPFKTGTPACSSHLRRYYGLKAKYVKTYFLSGGKCKIKYSGPFLYPSGFLTFPPGSIILPKGRAIDDVLEGKTTKVNEITQETLRELQAEQSTEPSVVKQKYHDIAVIRNLFEDSVNYRFDPKVAKIFDLDGVVRTKLERLASLYEKSEIVNKLGDYCQISTLSNGQQPIKTNMKSLKISSLNPILGYTLLHIKVNDRVDDFDKGTGFYTTYYDTRLGATQIRSVNSVIPLMQDGTCPDVDLYESFFAIERQLSQAEADRIIRGDDVEDFLSKEISRLPGVFNDTPQMRDRSMNHC